MDEQILKAAHYRSFVANGITLCESCHKELHKREGR